LNDEIGENIMKKSLQKKEKKSKEKYRDKI
jgi:hypothetical protein